MHMAAREDCKWTFLFSESSRHLFISFIPSQKNLSHFEQQRKNFLFNARRKNWHCVYVTFKDPFLVDFDTPFIALFDLMYNVLGKTICLDCGTLIKSLIKIQIKEDQCYLNTFHAANR